MVRHERYSRLNYLCNLSFTYPPSILANPLFFSHSSYTGNISRLPLFFCSHYNELIKTRKLL